MFKLYHQEQGTEELEKIFELERITQIFLSEITKLEFTSTVWKKYRNKDLSELQVIETIKFFESYFTKYTFIDTNSFVLRQAKNLITKYRTEGLRTLDGI